MSAPVARQDIVERLNRAIDELHRDVHRIEIWAGALSGFAHEVPEYRPQDDFLLHPGAEKARSA